VKDSVHALHRGVEGHVADKVGAYVLVPRTIAPAPQERANAAPVHEGAAQGAPDESVCAGDEIHVLLRHGVPLAAREERYTSSVCLTTRFSLNSAATISRPRAPMRARSSGSMAS